MCLRQIFPGKVSQMQMMMDVVILQSRGECRLPASIWLDGSAKRKRSRHAFPTLDSLRLSFYVSLTRHLYNDYCNHTSWIKLHS
jgi:hypothetical protein